MKYKPKWNGVTSQAPGGMGIAAARKGPVGEPKASALQGGKAPPAFGRVQEPASVPDSTAAHPQLTPGSPAREAVKPERPLDLVYQIAGHRVEQDGLLVDRHEIFPVDHIAYAFRGSKAIALSPKNRLVDAPKIRQMTLAPEGVYVRTIRGEVFLTKLPSVEAMLRRLHPAWFLRVNRGLLVNFRRLNEIDLNSSRVGFHIAGGIEWLRVSSSAVKALRPKLLLPQRSFPRVDTEDLSRG
jgi:hypothetical protein